METSVHIDWCFNILGDYYCVIMLELILPYVPSIRHNTQYAWPVYQYQYYTTQLNPVLI